MTSGKWLLLRGAGEFGFLLPSENCSHMMMRFLCSSSHLTFGQISQLLRHLEDRSNHDLKKSQYFSCIYTTGLKPARLTWALKQNEFMRNCKNHARHKKWTAMREGERSRVVELWEKEGGTEGGERALSDCGSNPEAICCSLSLLHWLYLIRSSSQHKAETHHSPQQ